MKKPYEERYRELLAVLATIDENQESEFEEFRSAMNSIQEAIKWVRTTFESQPPKDEVEEIDFFKETKPAFYALLIFAQEKFSILNRRPLVQEQDLKNYYLEELKYIFRFFQLNQFHYQYYRLRASQLDGQFFVRRAGVEDQLLPEHSAVCDPSFSTGLDYLAAKFMAYEKLRDYLISLLEHPESNNPVFKTSRKGIALRWTGDTCNLIELAYGIL
jgi:RteC protein